MKIILFLILSFLIGGIPTGFIVVKLKDKKDVRNYGSGNIGFTNVLRVSGLLPGIIVLIIDVSKAFLTSYLLSILTQNPEFYRLLFGLTVIIGNIFSPFLGFKGGKGVATGLGVALAMSPLGAAVAVGSFLFVLLITRYVSAGSITGSFIYMLVNIIQFLRGKDVYRLIFSILLFIFVIYTHRENIKRIIDGTENKIGKRKE